MQADLGPVTFLVRFSFPARGGFRTADADLSAAEARLYDPARLARRFALFEALTLPSLRAQTDGDFRVVVLVGEGLPAEALGRLHAGLAPLRGASVVALPFLHAYEAAQRALDRVPAGALRVSLRLDDDDAVDVGFVARLRRLLPTLAPLRASDAPLIVAFNRGHMLDLSGPRPVFTPVVERLPLGCGTAMIAPAAGRENIYRRNHRWLAQFYDVFSEARTPAFVRAVHADNDSDGAAVGRVLPLTPAEIGAELAAGFPFLPADWRAAAVGP